MTRIIEKTFVNANGDKITTRTIEAAHAIIEYADGTKVEISDVHASEMPRATATPEWKIFGIPGDIAGRVLFEGGEIIRTIALHSETAELMVKLGSISILLQFSAENEPPPLVGSEI